MTDKQQPSSRDDPHHGRPGPYAELDKDRKEIRLLVVQPGRGEEPLRCAFRPAFLADKPLPDYETISYVWGDPALRGSIELHGQLLEVPASSEEALLRMRDDQHSRVLWIDAVCINQNDTKERGHQVLIMGEIYANTTTNLIWLGEEDYTTTSAFKAFRVIYEEMRELTNNFQRLSEVLYSSGQIAFSHEGIQAHFNIDAVVSFFSRPWFSRLWVCQEASLAKCNLCCCGTQQISLDQILHVALWIYHRQRLPYHLRLSAGALRALDLAGWQPYGINRIHANTKPNLLTLLYAFRDFEAADPRDHVWAILGLLQTYSALETIPPDLTPDYTASLSDVLYRATRFAIAERRDLECLRHVSHWSDDERLPDLPTWVPRWDRKWDQTKDPFWFRCHMQRADRDATFNPDFTLSQPQNLMARGVLIGVVNGLLSTFSADDKAEDLLAFLKDVEAAVSSSHGRTSLSGKIGLTLVGGSTASGLAVEEFESGRGYDSFRRFLTEQNMLPQLQTAKDEHQAVANVHESMKNACYRQKFFTSDSGHFGLGPQTIVRGDVVTVLFGCRYPIVLRPLRSGEYECVGHAYVYGIMDGQALRKPNRQDETFRIR